MSELSTILQQMIASHERAARELAVQRLRLLAHRRHVPARLCEHVNETIEINLYTTMVVDEGAGKLRRQLAAQKHQSA